MPTTANTARIQLSGLAGRDTLTVGSGLPAATLFGGAAADVLNGGDGADELRPGAGNDTVDGGNANDVIFLGVGNDTVIWNPGDDNDVIEGEAGVDTLQFTGSSDPELITLSANGNRLRLFRNVAAVTLDAGTLERVAVVPGDLDESVDIDDLTGPGSWRSTSTWRKPSAGGGRRPHHHRFRRPRCG